MAIQTRPVSEGLQHRSALRFSRTLSDPPRRAHQAAPRYALGPATRMKSVGPVRVTVGADDVAFRDLTEQTWSWREHCLRPCDAELLRIRVTVVEVHLMRQEHAMAIQTGNLAKASKKFHRDPLATNDPIELALTIPRVVTDVVRMLVTTAAHFANLARSGRGVNRTRGWHACQPSS